MEAGPKEEKKESMTGDIFTKKTCIGDTGALFRMTNLADGMFETKNINEQVKVVNSTNMTVETQSSFHHSIGILNPRYSEVNGKVMCNLLANSMRLHSKLDLKFNL